MCNFKSKNKRILRFSLVQTFLIPTMKHKELGPETLKNKLLVL